MIEQLTIASYNVQCLGKDITGKRKRKEIKDFFLNTKPKPDLLLIQEHSCSLQEVTALKEEREF
jgi:hypothetical protein